VLTGIGITPVWIHRGMQSASQWCVEEANEHAFLATDSERTQHATETFDTLGEIAIGPDFAVIDMGGLVGAARVEVALENIRSEIVIARDSIRGRRRRRPRLIDIHRGVSSENLRGLCPAGQLLVEVQGIMQ
jgi:hypothetical protein